ncbi:MAG: NADH:ubiquinone reductase (Na(+)-transporting) subunit F [Gammaproteobacteria bacterium]|nr:NADH:ubiquinone reductase (Na(+)-transporting) subunit F [Gammaproteobacteria bacterium]
MSAAVQILVSVGFFAGFVLLLSILILLARARLMPDGNADVVVNEKRRLDVHIGEKLLQSLSQSGLYLPSGCGGKGTCGQCRVQVVSGGGGVLPTETALLSYRELTENTRLACQVTVRENMEVRIPDDVFGVRKWQCRVRSNRNVATYIKELVLELPEHQDMDFRAGGYIQVHCPLFQVQFSDFDIDQRFHSEWQRYQLWRHHAEATEPTTRAYSMANYPGEKGVVVLNVRIATPPPGADDDIPAGLVSSYIFALRPGDAVEISGPYGEFFVRDTDREMVYIGGGAGMAPLRSHIFDLLTRQKSQRKISFWYGARSHHELFYAEDFDQLAKQHDNFTWHIALSEPQREVEWQGPTGFIHDVVANQYLNDHPAPEECEYYLCGPPLMISAVMKMLDDLGVERDSILFDDFGG